MSTLKDSLSIGLRALKAKEDCPPNFLPLEISRIIDRLDEVLANMEYAVINKDKKSFYFEQIDEDLAQISLPEHTYPLYAVTVWLTCKLQTWAQSENREQDLDEETRDLLEEIYNELYRIRYNQEDQLLDQRPRHGMKQSVL